MKIPSEILIVWERPISCFGRVIPATLAPLASVLVAESTKTISDISSIVWLSTTIAMIAAFFSTLSSWLSTGSAKARSDIEAREGTITFTKESK